MRQIVRKSKGGKSKISTYQSGGSTRSKKVAENLKIKQMKAEAKSKRKVTKSEGDAKADANTNIKKSNRARRISEISRAVRTKTKNVNVTGDRRLSGDNVSINKTKTNVNSMKDF